MQSSVILTTSCKIKRCYDENEMRKKEAYTKQQVPPFIIVSDAEVLSEVRQMIQHVPMQFSTTVRD